MAIHKSVVRTRPIVIVNDAHEFNFSFTIKDFIGYMSRETRQTIQSPLFDCKSDNKCDAKWMLEVCTSRGDDNEHGEHLGVFLKLQQAPKQLEDLDVQFEVSIIAGNMNRLKSNKSGFGMDRISEGSGWSDFISLQQMLENRDSYLTDGHLRLECVGKAFFNVRPLPGEPYYFREKPYSRRDFELKRKHDIEVLD